MIDGEPTGHAVTATPDVPSASNIVVPHFSVFTDTLNIHTVLVVVITIIFIWWAIFTLVAAYHWFRYGRESWFAVPAMALHLFVSGWIFVFATGGLH